MKLRNVVIYAVALLIFVSISMLVKIDRETKMHEESVTEETLSETTPETTSPEPEATEPVTTEAEYEEFDESAAAEKGFYTTVTDYEGNEKILYYLWGTDGEPAYIYMEKAGRDPIATMGYVSIVSQNVAAEKNEFSFGSEFEDFIGKIGGRTAYIDYCPSDGVSKVTTAEDTAELLDTIAQTAPKLIPVDDSVIYYKYKKKRPIADVCFFGETGSMSASLIVSFAEHNGRLAAKFYAADYSELDKLAAKNSATEEELRAAYAASSEAESGWFYADSIDGADKFYDKLLKAVIMSDKNGLNGVRQCRTEENTSEGFSGDIADYLYTDRSKMDGYTEIKYRDDLTFMLPSGKEPTVLGDIITWEQDGVKLIISGTYAGYSGFMRYEGGEIYSGDFAGKNAICVCGHQNADGTFSDILSISGTEGNCTVKLFYDGTERTEEYDTLCRNIFGSFKLAAEASSESVESIYGEAAPIKLSDEPSRFTDEGYSLAEAYERTRLEEAVPKYQAYVPRLLVGGFYALDFRNEYEMKYETHIEKLAEDGKWYEVLPVADIYEEKGSDWFGMFSVLDDHRNTYAVDMSVYPPLPEGRYRLARPFRRKDSPDKEYGAFMEFDMVGTDERMDISAECETPTYEKAPKTIAVNVTSEFIYMQSKYYDIEYYDGEKWSSVRTAPIEVNSSDGSYVSNMNGLVDIGLKHKEIPTDGFDLSRTGKYRVRINVSDEGNSLPDNYGVLYAEFHIG